MTGDLSPLAAFAIADYGRGGNKDAYLVLQDVHGADVLILILARWLKAEGKTLPAQDWRRAISFSKERQAATVWPLRNERRSLDQNCSMAAERKSTLLREEIDAELAIMNELHSLTAEDGEVTEFVEDYLSSLNDPAMAIRRFYALSAPQKN